MGKLQWIVLLCVITICYTRDGIILSGGQDSDSVEVFDPSSGQSCFLPSLPEIIYGHSMHNTLVCGGGGDLQTQTCLALVSGNWVPNHSLVEKRIFHSGWDSELGVILMGGYESLNTSEIVADLEGDMGEAAFDLESLTVGSCSISEQSTGTMVLTGGVASKRGVFQYSSVGFVGTLPSLGEGRYHHGCGEYYREVNGVRVQVLLVSGGIDGQQHLSSTEVLALTGNPTPTWTSVSPLPKAVAGLRCVSAGGLLYLTGGVDGEGLESEAVFAWQEENWEKVGDIRSARSYHAVSTIQIDQQEIQYCTWE